MNPICSICIANYNGIDIIGDCLDAVLAQDTEINYEIIVHDDASTDGSAAYIRERYPDILLIESEKNVGYCISNNRMADVARGEFLLLLNNDAILFSDALRVLYQHASSQPVQGILGLPQYDAATGDLLDIGSLVDPFLNSVPNLNRDKPGVAMVAGACFWIPAKLWKDIGGFPSWFHTLAEDLYVCSVARLWNYPVEAIPYSGFRHWVGKSIGGGKITPEQRLNTSFGRRKLTERNKTFVMCVVFPALLLVPTLLLHLSLLYCEGALLTVLKRDMRIWREIYAPVIPALWRTRHRLAQYRKQVQGQRKARLPQFLRPFCVIPYKFRMLLKHGIPAIR